MEACAVHSGESCGLACLCVAMCGELCSRLRGVRVEVGC